MDQVKFEDHTICTNSIAMIAIFVCVFFLFFNIENTAVIAAPPNLLMKEVYVARLSANEAAYVWMQCWKIFYVFKCCLDTVMSKGFILLPINVLECLFSLSFIGVPHPAHYSIAHSRCLLELPKLPPSGGLMRCNTWFKIIFFQLSVNIYDISDPSSSLLGTLNSRLK